MDGEQSDFYFNATIGYILYQDHAEKKCSVVEYPQVDFSELIEKANDPNGGINQYLGLVKLPFFDEDLHKFTLTQPGDRQQDMYFIQGSLELKYVMIHDYPLIIALDSPGVVPKKWTDSDFKPYICRF